MRLKTMVFAGVALAAAGGAWAQEVKVDFDKAANFAAIKTFSLKIGTSWGNPIGEKRVTDEITQALAENRGWGAMGGMGTATTTASEYTVGTLVVDIFGAKEKNLMWRGAAQDELSDKPEKNIKKLGTLAYGSGDPQADGRRRAGPVQALGAPATLQNARGWE